jgi:hypothetical protein
MKRSAAAAVTGIRPLHAIKREKDTIAIKISNGSAQIVNPLNMIGRKVPALTSCGENLFAGGSDTLAKQRRPVARCVLSLSAGS